jgi:hypothetical protein
MADRNPRKTVSTAEALNLEAQTVLIKAHVRAILSQLRLRQKKPYGELTPAKWMSPSMFRCMADHPLAIGLPFILHALAAFLLGMLYGRWW